MLAESTFQWLSAQLVGRLPEPVLPALVVGTAVAGAMGLLW